MTRGSSIREQGGRRLPGRGTSAKGTVCLDVTGGPLETSGAFVEGAIDANMSEFPALEAGFMITRVVLGQRGVVVTTGPPDVGAFQGDFFFSG